MCVYHTITDVCTITLLPIEPSLDDHSGSRHCFRAEASLSLAQTPQQYLTTSPDFVRLSSLYGIAIPTQMQLEFYLGCFSCISSCLMEEVQD